MCTIRSRLSETWGAFGVGGTQESVFDVENRHCSFCEDHEGVGMAGGGFGRDEAAKTGVARHQRLSNAP